MKKIIGFILLIVLNNQCFASDVKAELILDKITFELAAKKWVNTTSALLTVNVNRTLGNEALVKVRADIMAELSKIATGEWHLIQFDRSQDSSGLEKVSIQAEARVDQATLTDLYKNAKAVSKPGANYEIGSIEFKPSLQEIQTVKNALREELYNLVQNELTRINKVYPNQSYSVSNIMFIMGDAPPLAQQPKTYQSRAMVSAATLETSTAPMTVSNELIMSAIVEVASNRLNINQSGT